MAARAHRLGAAPGPHFDFDRPTVLAKTSLVIDETRKVLAVVQQGDQPHESKTSRKRHIGHTSTAKQASFDDLAAYCPDLEQWPRSWRGEERDVPPGEKIVEYFTPFL